MSLIPYDDRDGFIWFDGQLIPFRDAKLHVLTHALHYASCVFEGERAYDGEVFHLTEHSQRLYDSARSEEHTSELQSLMRISYAVFCLKKKTTTHHRYILTTDYQIFIHI